jgi:Amt family ammonium transporter
VGWFGFNGGSALAADAAAAMAITVSHISAAVATITWALLDWTDPAVGKPTTLGAATGAIAGLAAITPAAGFVGPLGGLIMGIMSAVICRFFATTVKSKFNFDDTLDGARPLRGREY